MRHSRQCTLTLFRLSVLLTANGDTSPQAIGKPFTLWTAFARFYEKHNSLDNARVIFEKATAVPFKYVDDLASVWCEYAEMELRHQNYKRALDLLRRATAAPSTLDRRQVRSCRSSTQVTEPCRAIGTRTTAAASGNMGNLSRWNLHFILD